MTEALDRHGKRKSGEPVLQEGEYLIPSLQKIIKEDGEEVDLPEHTIVDVESKNTRRPCSSRKGYAIRLGQVPKPRAKARCGIYGDKQPTCWRVWK